VRGAPHDQLFKELLQAFLPEFVQLFFAEEAAQLDWRSLEFLDKELSPEVSGDVEPSSRRPRGRTVDVLARVRTADGQPELILVHVEIEADPRESFAERMYGYYSLLRRQRRLPVLPIAIYLRPGYGGVTRGRYEEWLLGRRNLLFEYHLVALPDVQRESLTADNPVTHALAPLLAGKTPGPVDQVLDSYTGIMRTTPDPVRQALLAQFVDAYTPLTTEELAELSARLGEPSLLEVGRMMTRWEARGIEKGLQEGIEKGLQEGIEKGLQEGIEKGIGQGLAAGVRRSIHRLLQARFGPLPSSELEVLNRITNISALESLVETAATAGSLDEFLRSVPVTEPHPGM